MKQGRSKKKRFLWITDPWDTLDHPHDTTLRLAQEALAQGHESWWTAANTLHLEEGNVRAHIQQLFEIPFAPQADDVRMGETLVSHAVDEFDSVHYRVDPPVDLTYLHNLHILSFARTEVINPPFALFVTNEKLEALTLGKDGEFAPPTLVASGLEDLQEFGDRHGKTILKPLNQAQSKGISVLDWSNPGDSDSARSALASLTDDFTQPVLLQKFLKGVQDKGELRLWFLDGKLLASARKVPKMGEAIINMDRGSTLVEGKPQGKELELVKVIGKRLKDLKVRLAAVDLIDGLVTDFNITSPGLLIQMEKLAGENLAQKIIRALAV
ncbi:hypothetical protein K2X30_06560 [bacterium]|nr:hypothetical protein [bacterium]